MAGKFPLESQVKPIHFFNIITTQSLHEGKLMIPSKFVEKYGEGLPNTLFLEPPNGTKWKMNLEKGNGKIWFQKGWKEFAEYHCLAHGHLLVFKFKRTSHFQVHIFDMSALEIEYPFKRVEGKMASSDQANNPSNDEHLEHHRPCQKRKDNSTMLCLQQCKMRCRKPEAALDHTDTKCKEKTMVIAKQVTALDRASSFEPSNPFFLLIMRPSYIQSRSRLSFPSKFCRIHFDLQNRRGDINLQVLNGRVWPARYCFSRVNKGSKFEITSGWKPFAKDNNLKVDDVCTFELILRTELTFQVHIFRVSDSSNCSTSQESSQMRAAWQGQRKEMKIINTIKSPLPKSFISLV